MADAAHTARAMWTLFEPIHAVTYFAPEARGAFEEAGLRGFWRGYFAGRAAPLGPAGAAVVTASFFNFAPAFVARAIPGVWELITPEDALRTRLAGVHAALRGLLAGRETEVTVAADLLWQAVGERLVPLFVGPAPHRLHGLTPQVPAAAQGHRLAAVDAGRGQGGEVPVTPVLSQHGGRLPEPRQARGLTR